MTIDAAYPPGVSEIAEESLHRFLDSIEQYRGALNAGRRGARSLAVTVSIEAAELEESEAANAAERGEAIARERLQMLDAGHEWRIESVEVSAERGHQSLHVLALPETAAAVFG